VDLTIEVMLPVRGAVGGAQTQPANPSWRLLAIVAVYPMKTVPTVWMPFTGYVHVTGVPDLPAWSGLTTEEIMRRINARLCRVWESVIGVTLEKREFAAIAASIPVGARNTLLSERQLTVTWTQFKNYVQNVKEPRALNDTDLD